MKTKNKFRMMKNIAIMVILIITSISIVDSTTTPDNKFDYKPANYKDPSTFSNALSKASLELWKGTEPDAPTTPWYQAKPEDIAVCKAYGGKESPVTSGGTITGNLALSELTVTIQADKTKLPDNSTLYQVSWYVEPIQGSATYTVAVVTSGGKENKFVPGGSATPGDGAAAEFFPFYSTEDYTKVRITASGAGQSGTLTVPIVQKIIYTPPTILPCEEKKGMVTCTNGVCRKVDACAGGNPTG